MRFYYLINIASFAFIFLLDFFFQAVFNIPHSTRILVVSQLHFLLLVLFAREDSRTSIVVKVIVVALTMDLLQYKSFPVYYISYGIAIMVTRFWHRHISESYPELLLLGSVALFIKEILLFISLTLMNLTNMSVTTFIATRSLWVVLVNLILFFIPYRVYQVSQKALQNFENQSFRQIK